MSDWQLAQLNIAQLLAPLDSPQLVDFVNNLDRINILAECSPGFIWRLVEGDEDFEATLENDTDYRLKDDHDDLLYPDVLLTMDEAEEEVIADANANIPTLKTSAVDHSPSHFGPNVIVNLSVWESIEHLYDFVYLTAHMDVMRRKKEWFQRMVRAHMVLWWVPAGEQPTVAEAREHLDFLRANGPTEFAFTFRQAFVKPGSLLSEPVSVNKVGASVESATEKHPVVTSREDEK